MQRAILQVDIPSFYDGNQVVTVAIPESVTLPLKIASLKSMTIPMPVTSIEGSMCVTALGIVGYLCTLQVVGEHDYPQACDGYQLPDVRHRLGDSYAFESAFEAQILAKDRHSRKIRKRAVRWKVGRKTPSLTAFCCNCSS